MLKRATLSVSEPPRKCAETGFAVTLEKTVWRCLLRAKSHRCDTLEAEKQLSTRHGAGRYHSCVRYTISSGYTVHGKKRPNRLLATKAETQRQAHSQKETA